jgi:hypothetical protein
MGNFAAASYNMAVCIGLASFQASESKFGLAQDAINTSIPFATTLKSGNFIDDIVFKRSLNVNPADNSVLIALRQEVEQVIRSKSNSLANIFRLGLLIAIAEGQTTSSQFSKAVDIAHSSLKNAKLVITQNFPNLGFDLNPLDQAIRITQNFGAGPKNSYNVVFSLRQSYADFALRANLP